MDPLDQVKKLREEYERALDAAESRRSAYHEAVLELYRGGTPLREIAKELGLSHQRVHQIVSAEPPRKSKLPRAAGGAAGAMLILLALTFGALRLAHAPPFSPGASASPVDASAVSVPNVLNQPWPLAVRRVERAGLHVRVVQRKHGTPTFLADRVFAQSGAAGSRVAKGSLVTIYVARLNAPHATAGGARLGGIAHPPGGAIARHWRRVLVRTTPIGVVSMWDAPDRVSPSARCSWLQVGRVVDGGSCYQPPRRGIPQTVSPVLRLKSGARLPIVWGRVNANVRRLTLVLHDGTRIVLPVRDGLFLYAAAIPESRWRRGHSPASLVARDGDGRIVDRRSLCWGADGVSYASSVCASRGTL